MKMMEKKSSNVAKKFGDVCKINRHPAILVYLVNNSNMISWQQILDNKDNLDDFYDKESYKRWRNSMVNHVLNLLDVNFEMLLPCNLPNFLEKINKVDYSILLEAAENIWDVFYDNPIGTIRREGWDYIKYDESKALGMTEREWIINTKLQNLVKVPDSMLSYYEIILYLYWHKRLRGVRE